MRKVDLRIPRATQPRRRSLSGWDVKTQEAPGWRVGRSGDAEASCLTPGPRGSPASSSYYRKLQSRS